MNNSAIKIGLTMRVVNAVSYNEGRDAIAHDWIDFLRLVFPKANWVPLPNLQQNIIHFVNEFKINSLILTGGETPGISKLRDETEDCLIDWAVKKEIPIFGVCRGMQKIVLNFGGELVSCNKEEHVANRHKIIWLNEQIKEVNSYHEYGIDSSNLPDCFQSLAETADKRFVEAIRHKSLPIMAVMWHPEREQKKSELDLELFKEFSEYIH